MASEQGEETGKGTGNLKGTRNRQRGPETGKGRETGEGTRNRKGTGNRKGDQKQERGQETGKRTGNRKRDGSTRFDCLLMRVSGHWLEPHGNVIYILLRRVGIKWFPQVLFSLDLYIAT